MKIAHLLFLLAGCIVLALLALRIWDEYADREEWARLARLQPAQPGRYTASLVAHLPEPARRYFNFSIAPGTPLFPVAEIDMEGEFSLGTKEAPAYRSMMARQILATPSGFVWRLSLPGSIPISGSDSAFWTRFRLGGLFPVARFGGNPDHRRSAFGRFVAESVFWTPAALLPQPNVVWEEVAPDVARVTVRHEGLEQAVDVVIDGDGRPTEVRFMRWSNANPEKTFRLQAFGGHLGDFREVGGFRLPFRVSAGNHFGTADYFPFFKAKVTAIRFPDGPFAATDR